MVVSEINERLGHNGGDKGHVHSCLDGNARCHRYQGDYRTHTRTYGHGYETGSQEKPGIKEFPGKDAQSEIHGRIYRTHIFGRTGKGSRQDEYPYHQKDIPVSGAFGEYFYPFFRTVRRSDQQGISRCQQESGGDGHLVEIRRHHRRYQIYAQKKEKRT